MAQVRMHSPPARTVKKLSFRWDRQRPIVRGHADDHEEVVVPPEPTPLEITSVTPDTVVEGATTTSFSVVGTAFIPGSTIRYTVNAEAEKTATSIYVSQTAYTFSIPAADLDTDGTIAWTMAPPSADPVDGPEITITAA